MIFAFCMFVVKIMMKIITICSFSFCARDIVLIHNAITKRLENVGQVFLLLCYQHICFIRNKFCDVRFGIQGLWFLTAIQWLFTFLTSIKVDLNCQQLSAVVLYFVSLFVSYGSAQYSHRIRRWGLYIKAIYILHRV